MPIVSNRRAFLAASAACLVSPKVEAASVAIVGGGSRAVTPIVRQWIDRAPKSLEIDVVYSPSQDELTKLLSAEIDFALADTPVADDKLAVGNLYQFPVAFGALAIAVAIPGIPNNRLVLDGSLLGGIYAGRIKVWNDPLIVAANPGLGLPDLAIRPLHEGTPTTPMTAQTYNFTQYLLATNPDWREKFGAAVSRRWAVGSQVPTSDEMASVLGSLPGAICPVPLETAKARQLTMAALKNKAGKRVEASVAACHAAVHQVDWAKVPDMVTNLADLPGEASWPLTIATYAVLARRPKNRDRGAATRTFFQYVVGEGGNGIDRFSAVGLTGSEAAAAMTLLTRR